MSAVIYAGKLYFVESEVVETLDNGAVVVTTDPLKMKELREKREKALFEKLLSEREYWVEEMETRAYTQSMIDDVDRRIASLIKRST